MKKLMIIFFISAMIIGCGDGKKEDEKIRYTQDSEEINTLKALISDYEKGDWEAMKKHYADTAQIFHNTTKGMSIDEIVKNHEESLSDMSSYGFEDGEDEYEMVLTDDGNTWVNYWGEWKGTFSRNGKEVIIPVHLTARFEDGQIVREVGYWDNAIILNAMQEMDTTMTNQEESN